MRLKVYATPLPSALVASDSASVTTSGDETVLVTAVGAWRDAVHVPATRQVMASVLERHYACPFSDSASALSFRASMAVELTCDRARNITAMATRCRSIN